MGREILRTCRRKRLVAAVNFQGRYAPNVIAARDLIDRGLLGELYDMEVRVTCSTPWSLFPYILNLARLEMQQHSVHYVCLELADGELRRFPRSWTSLVPPDPYELLTSPPLLRVDSLRELSEWLSNLKPRGKRRKRKATRTTKG